MSKKQKTWLDNLLNFGENHPKRLIIYLLLLGGGIQLFIQSVYWIGRWKGIITDFSAGDMLGFWGSFLAFIGTFILGAIALWQNKKVNDINERLLEIEEAKFCPMLDFSLIGIDIFTEKIQSAIYQNYLIYDLDDKKCELRHDGVIENKHDELTWVFNSENTSEVRIISTKLTQVFVHSLMPNGDFLHFSTKNIKYVGDEKFDPHESKPIIISGITNFYKTSEEKDPPIIQIELLFNLTNAIGDIYSAKMSFFVRAQNVEDKVMFPETYTKIYDKPKKYT